jgi:hypothetical protein
MGCYGDGAAQFRAAPHDLARARCSYYLVRCAKNSHTLRYLTCTRRFADVRTRVHPKLRKEAVHFCGFCATETWIGNCAHVRSLLTRVLASHCLGCGGAFHELPGAQSCVRFGVINFIHLLVCRFKNWPPVVPGANFQKLAPGCTVQKLAPGCACRQNTRGILFLAGIILLLKMNPFKIFTAAVFWRKRHENQHFNMCASHGRNTCRYKN